MVIEFDIVSNIPAPSEREPECGIMLDVVRILIFHILFHLECYPRLQVPNSHFVAHFSSLIIIRFPVCIWYKARGAVRSSRLLVMYTSGLLPSPADSSNHVPLCAIPFVHLAALETSSFVLVKHRSALSFLLLSLYYLATLQVISWDTVVNVITGTRFNTLAASLPLDTFATRYGRL